LVDAATELAILGHEDGGIPVTLPDEGEKCDPSNDNVPAFC
jgi:hypothetical protein